MSSEAVLELNDVSVSFRGRSVLEHVSWRLDAGDFVGVIGPNGAGKSTLLKVVLGLLKPDTGVVKVFGKNPAEVRGRVGYVPQFARLDFEFPICALDVVLMGRLAVRRLFRRYSDHDRTIALEALRRVEMEQFRSRQIGRLSGGELQRVLIARALAAEPKLLLLDEPTASLDSHIGRELYQVLAELSPEVTIVLVSHDIGVISSHVKTIACLNRRMHYHHSKEITGEMIHQVYGCPIDLIAHGHAHRVLPAHEDLSVSGGDMSSGVPVRKSKD